MTENRKIERPAFYGNSFEFKPTSRYIVSAGSVGQPRDDNREAGYLIYDTENYRVTKRIFQYQVESTIQKIIAAGLPEKNGTRLRKE